MIYMLFILTFFCVHIGFAQIQKYNCEVIELSTGKRVNIYTGISNIKFTMLQSLQRLAVGDNAFN